MQLSIQLRLTRVLFHIHLYQEEHHQDNSNGLVLRLGDGLLRRQISSGLLRGKIATLMSNDGHRPGGRVMSMMGGRDHDLQGGRVTKGLVPTQMEGGLVTIKVHHPGETALLGLRLSMVAALIEEEVKKVNCSAISSRSRWRAPTHHYMWHAAYCIKFSLCSSAWLSRRF